MALAGHHVKDTSTLHHRHAALQLLRKRLTTWDRSSDAYNMLDTIVILFSLDVTHALIAFTILQP